jgi:glutamate---cysteine ligase / carboxylate-amine ligase
LHPVFGTIEVRAPDAQAAIEDVEAIATVVHCLVRWLASRHEDGEQLPAHEPIRIAENRWRAAVDGVDAAFVDLDHGRRPLARQLISDLLAGIRAYAHTDRERLSLRRAEQLLEAPHPSSQRATADRSGLGASSALLPTPPRPFVTQATSQSRYG